MSGGSYKGGGGKSKGSGKHYAHGGNWESQLP